MCTPETHFTPQKKRLRVCTVPKKEQKEKDDDVKKTLSREKRSACGVRTGTTKKNAGGGTNRAGGIRNGIARFLNQPEGPGGGTHLGGTPPILVPASRGGMGGASDPSQNCLLTNRE